MLVKSRINFQNISLVPKEMEVVKDDENLQRKGNLSKIVLKDSEKTNKD